MMSQAESADTARLIGRQDSQEFTINTWQTASPASSLSQHAERVTLFQAKPMTKDVSPAIIVTVLAALSLLLLIVVVTVHRFRYSCSRCNDLGEGRDAAHGNAGRKGSGVSHSSSGSGGGGGDRRSSGQPESQDDTRDRRSSLLLLRQASLPFTRPAEPKKCLDTPSTSFSSYLHLKSVESTTDTLTRPTMAKTKTTNGEEESTETSVALEYRRTASSGISITGTSTMERRTRSLASGSVSRDFTGISTCNTATTTPLRHVFSTQHSAADHDMQEDGTPARKARRSRTTSSVSSVHHSLQATSSLGSATSHCAEDEDDVFSRCSRGSVMMPQLVTFPDFSDNNRTPTPPGAVLRSRLSSVSPMTVMENDPSVRSLHGETHRTLSGGDHLHGSHNPVLFFHRAESSQSLADRTLSGESQRSVRKKAVAASHSHTAAFALHKPADKTASAIAACKQSNYPPKGDQDTAGGIPADSKPAAINQEQRLLDRTPRSYPPCAPERPRSACGSHGKNGAERWQQQQQVPRPQSAQSSQRPSHALGRGVDRPSSMCGSVLTAPVAARQMVVATNRQRDQQQAHIERGPANINTVRPTSRSRDASPHIPPSQGVEVRVRPARPGSAQAYYHGRSSQLNWIRRQSATPVLFSTSLLAPARPPPKSSSLPCLTQQQEQFQQQQQIQQQQQREMVNPALWQQLRPLQSRAAPGGGGGGGGSSGSIAVAVAVPSHVTTRHAPAPGHHQHQNHHGSTTEIATHGYDDVHGEPKPGSTEHRPLQHTSSLPTSLYCSSDDVTTSAESSLSSGMSSDSLDLPRHLPGWAQAAANSYPWTDAVVADLGAMATHQQQQQQLQHQQPVVGDPYPSAAQQHSYASDQEASASGAHASQSQIGRAASRHVRYPSLGRHGHRGATSQDVPPVDQYQHAAPTTAAPASRKSTASPAFTSWSLPAAAHMTDEEEYLRTLSPLPGAKKRRKLPDQQSDVIVATMTSCDGMAGQEQEQHYHTPVEHQYHSLPIQYQHQQQEQQEQQHQHYQEQQHQQQQQEQQEQHPHQHQQQGQVPYYEHRQDENHSPPPPYPYAAAKVARSQSLQQRLEGTFNTSMPPSPYSSLDRRHGHPPTNQYEVAENQPGLHGGFFVPSAGAVAMGNLAHGSSTYEMKEAGVTPAPSFGGDLNYPSCTNASTVAPYYYNFSSFKSIVDRHATRSMHQHQHPHQHRHQHHAASQSAMMSSSSSSTPGYSYPAPSAQEVFPLTAQNLQASADGRGVASVYGRYPPLNAGPGRSNSQKLSSNSIASRSSSDRTATTGSTLTDGRRGSGFYGYDDVAYFESLKS